METWAIILAVIIPLVVFMWTMLPWIKHVIKADMGEVKERIATIEGQLSVLLEHQKQMIDVYMKMKRIANPNNEEAILLTKLKNDTITRQEAIRLQKIMSSEKESAEQENDFLKAVLIIGILGLIAYDLSRQ